MENFDIILKTILFYLVLIIIIRSLGKREVGEINVFDLVVLLLVADIATLAITDNWNLVIPSILSLISLVLLQKIFALFSLHFPFIRKVIDYSPSVIIFDGKLNIKEMNKQKYTIDDLITQSREKGIMDLGEIKMAILESTGQLSIYKKDVYRNQILPVVVSGIIKEDNLKMLNLNKEIIIEYINNKKIMMNEINYLASDGKNFYIMDVL
jgi:uncharacterized membrane protein YcaP (DUF421 family)